MNAVKLALMTRRLYAATTNQGKLRDFRAASAVHSFEIIPMPGMDGVSEPKENGKCFADNAAIKAVYYSKHVSGRLVVADDSGLEVDALDGAPGVRSARFAADNGIIDSPDAEDNTDVWNNIVLLQKLACIPMAQRTARYRCVLAAGLDGAVLFKAEGSVEGVILDSPRGTGGFGYDPLFYMPELDKTMAEIDLETKLRLSHRGRALEALLIKMGA